MSQTLQARHAWRGLIRHRMLVLVVRQVLLRCHARIPLPLLLVLQLLRAARQRVGVAKVGLGVGAPDLDRLRIVRPASATPSCCLVPATCLGNPYPLSGMMEWTAKNCCQGAISRLQLSVTHVHLIPPCTPEGSPHTPLGLLAPTINLSPAAQ